MQKDFVLLNFCSNNNVEMKRSGDSDLNKAVTWVKAGKGSAFVMLC